MRLWRHQSRLTGLALLAVYGVGLLGVVPIPAFRAPRNSGERYPCERHACGCWSADQCWEQCCCLTPSQRRAWAIRNQVTPRGPAIYALDDNDEPRSCCSTTHCDSESESDSSDAPTDKAPLFVFGFSAAKCGGTFGWMAAAAPALPLRMAPSFITQLNPVGRVAPLLWPAPIPRTLRPETPPPRPVA